MSNPLDRFRLSVNPNSVTPAGSDQSGATELRPNVICVAVGDGSAGLRLPSLASFPGFCEGAGMFAAVFNSHASAGLKIYPHSGGNINGGSTDAAIEIEGHSVAFFIALNATTWASVYTVNS